MKAKIAATSAMLLGLFNFSSRAYSREFVCSDRQRKLGRIQLSDQVNEIVKPVWTCVDYVSSGDSDSSGYCNKFAWVSKDVLVIDAKVDFAIGEDRPRDRLTIEKIKTEHFEDFRAEVTGYAPHSDFSFFIAYNMPAHSLTVTYRKEFESVPYGRPRWATQHFNCR